MDDPFMKKGIMLIIDGSDPELVKSVMETEIGYMAARHNQTIAVFNQMAAFAPAFGMCGTVIGLVNMLRDLDDVDALGPNMALALVTTFYGVILANLVFTPFARKLGARSSVELLRKEIVLEGILSIQDGENPRIIKEKLNAFLPASQVAASKAKEAAAGGGGDRDVDE
jgi:chemotaxis protein MotA